MNRKYLLGLAAALIAGLALAQTATRFAAIRVDNLTSNRVVLGGGTLQLTPLAAGTSATLLHGNASGAPSFGSVDLAAEVGSSILPVANGGLNLSAAADDNVAVGNGTTWQTKALTSCSGASSAVTYNTSTNAFGCNTISAGTTQTTANFTATFSTGCSTTSPTIPFTYSLTGIAVVLSQPGPGANWPCTSNATTLRTASGAAPAAIRPATNTRSFLMFSGFDNGGATVGVCLAIAADGTMSLFRYATNDCSGAWTASGSKNINTGNAGSPAAGVAYNTTD